MPIPLLSAPERLWRAQCEWYLCVNVHRNLSYLTAGHYGPRIGVPENIYPFCTFPSPDRKGLREEGTEERFSKDGRGRGTCYLFTGVDFIFK